jgi:tetratricopeptide (TPR) repeat protein
MKPGSIEDTIVRLTLWSRRAPKGLARVEFDSEFARKRVVNGLRLALAEAGILFHEIELPPHTPASQVVQALVDQLDSLTPGVVSITGFATAFPNKVPLEDSLRIFNFNREELAQPTLRQIWWMPTSFAGQFIRAVPDLNSWFLIRLYLTEVVTPTSEIQPILEQTGRLTVNIEDARKRAANLVARFEQALAAGVPARELRQNLAIPAVSALLEGGAEKEAQELALTLAQKITQAGVQVPEEAAKGDFFISYTNADGKWAEWIAYQLEETGYSTVIQAWDFRPGANFVLEMQEAASTCERTIAVLSPHYLSSKFTAPEWAAAFAVDPTGKERTLVPVRVAPCEPQGLLGPIVYIDLVGLDEATARARLLSGVRGVRAKPQETPEYPGRRIPTKLPTAERPEFPGTLPSLWNVPYSRNSFFTGREEALEQLHDAFTPSTATAQTRIQVISGFGGVGKTQTAVEYAYRHRDNYGAVLWASAATEPVASFVNMAKLLDLSEKDARNQDETVHAVKVWLENNTGWLLVFDNADKPESIKSFLPSKPKGNILVTSRAQIFDMLGVAKPIELRKMSPEEAITFFFRRTRRDENPAERKAATQIADELGGLPLALEQAGAYIAKVQCSFQDYLTSYRKRGLQLLEKSTAVTGEYPKSVATTWALNFEQVERTSKAAADLLRFSAFLNPDRIPLELITLGAVELGPALSAALADVDTDPLVLDEILEPLTQFSLIHRDIESRTYDIHRLVQIVLKAEMDEATQRLWAARTARAVNCAFPDVEFSTWPRCERLLPHAQACAELIEKWRLEFREAGRLLNQAGLYLHDHARFAEAEPFYRRALVVSEKVLGLRDPDVATSLNNLAELYRDQGRYDEAEPLYRRSLVIREKALGPDHPDVAQSLHNLGLLCQNQDRNTEAEPLLQRALAIREKALGPNHPSIALSLNSLAALYHLQGRYTEAEPLLQRTLAIREKALEPDHPSVATSLNNLALLYKTQGKYTEAEPLYQQVLRIDRKALGAEHPHVARDLNNLAELYRAQGNYDKAEPLYQRALTIFEKTLGLEYPDIAIVLENYAALLRRTNREVEAAKLEARAQAIRTKHAQENLTK